MSCDDHPRAGARRTLVLAGVLVGTALLVAACAAGPNTAVAGPDAAGFWLGLWQGLISPITFIVSLFNPDVSIYEVHNNGNWYNFGFVIGIAAVFSGPLSARAGRRRRR